jgi:hypothetical protein
MTISDINVYTNNDELLFMPQSSVSKGVEVERKKAECGSGSRNEVNKEQICRKYSFVNRKSSNKGIHACSTPLVKIKVKAASNLNDGRRESKLWNIIRDMWGWSSQSE